MKTAEQHGMPYGALPAPDVVDFLLGQHSTIRDLMMNVMGGVGDERKVALRDLVRLLSVHEAAEEEVVHPIARRNIDDGDPMVEDRLHEEHQAKELLEQLDGMDPDDPQFLPLFLKMRQAVITHAVYEQRYEFGRLRKSVSPAQLQSMRAMVKAGESMAPTHPHAGVESATANVLVGTPTAMFDRARDMFRRAAQGGDSSER